MLELKKVTKRYRKGNVQIPALVDFDCTLNAGRFYAVCGPSGAGKSTLLMIVGGMLRPESGEILYQGRNLYGLSGAARNRYRQKSIGFVFQKFHLMPYLTVLDNIRIPLTLAAGSPGSTSRAEAAAARLGLSARLRHYPRELSVGQQQRVAVARTLAGNPEIILADEPTGNLDEANQRIIADCLHEETKHGKLVVVATHEPMLCAESHHQIQLENGRMTCFR